MEQPPIEEQELTQEQLSELLQIRRDKLAALQQPETIRFFTPPMPFRTPANRFFPVTTSLEEQAGLHCGRMISRRVMGKASFLHLLDGKAAFRRTSAGTTSARTHTPRSKRTTSAISSA